MSGNRSNTTISEESYNSNIIETNLGSKRKAKDDKSFKIALASGYSGPATNYQGKLAPILGLLWEKFLALITALSVTYASINESTTENNLLNVLKDNIDLQMKKRSDLYLMPLIIKS